MDQNEALQVLVHAADLGIAKGIFQRVELKVLMEAIETFENPPKQEEVIDTLTEQVEKPKKVK